MELCEEEITLQQATQFKSTIMLSQRVCMGTKIGRGGGETEPHMLLTIMDSSAHQTQWLKVLSDEILFDSSLPAKLRNQGKYPYFLFS